MDKYLGKRLEGRYDIVELIGSGGMANVYRAYDIIDERTVAVKILRDEYIGNSEFIRRFKNESKAIALLNHPNIVRVYDVSFTNTTHSIVMEYIDGVSLKEFIRHKDKLSPNEAIHFNLQILNALQHAHDKGIVHRDIKPQNIMLLRNGQIKVTDFGIARFARSEVRTITDRAIGSVHYISPEQAVGDNTDEKSDIYSVGVMLFEMLTGELPFEADTAVSVAIKQVQSEAPTPRSINPDVPIGLEEIVMKAMEKDPSYRYQSAAEMIEDLHQFHRDPTISFGYSKKRSTSRTSGSALERARQGSESASNREGRDSRGGRGASKSGNPSKSRTPFLRTLFLTTLAVMLATAGFVGIMFYLNNPFTMTPQIDSLYNMVGERYEEVERRHYPIVLKPEYVYNNDIANGVVIDQKPRAESVVKEGAAVHVTVSLGPADVTIPDFVGLPASRVVGNLQDLGLIPEEGDARSFNDDVAAGCVISMEPAPGKVVPSGSAISLLVSNGPDIKLVNVPDIRGMSVESARKLLEATKFMSGTVSEAASDLPEGTIISQVPTAGSLELEGSSVSMVMSRGGLKTWSITVPLPTDMDRAVPVRARTGEDTTTVVYNETFNPAQVDSGIWRPSFSGQEGTQLLISIYIDKKEYQQYLLDFSTGQAELLKDNSHYPDFHS